MLHKRAGKGRLSRCSCTRMLCLALPCLALDYSAGNTTQAQLPASPPRGSNENYVTRCFPPGRNSISVGVLLLSEFTTLVYHMRVERVTGVFCSCLVREGGGYLHSCLLSASVHRCMCIVLLYHENSRKKRNRNVHHTYGPSLSCARTSIRKWRKRM
jgi:hypothetical protein